MRRLHALLFVAGLLLAATDVSAAPGKGQSSDRGRGPFQPVGAFELVTSERTATGDYVSFNYSESGVTDYRAANRTLFSISVQGENEDEDQEDDDEERGRGSGVVAAGGEIRLRMRNFTFIAHDAPTATARLDAEGSVTVVFAPGVVLARDNGGQSERIRFTYGEVTGVLRGDDARIVGTTVVSNDDVLIVLDAPRGPFENHRDLGRAIGKGHVGAEGTIRLDDEDKVKDDIVSYGNVTMTTVKAEQGNITVIIEGHGFDGRVIVLNVDGRVLGAESADKLQIFIDNESVRPASNLTDILDPDDDGFYPEYYIVFDPGAQAFQLLATLPHYSVHTLSVTTAFVLPPPSVMIGIVAGLALLVPTALVLFRRK